MDDQDKSKSANAPSTEPAAGGQKQPDTNIGKTASVNTDQHEGESLVHAKDIDEALSNLGILVDLPISLTIEIGRAQIKMRDLLHLTKGSVIELNKSAGDPIDVYANGKLISSGTIITANGKYCVKLISVPEKISDFKK